MDNSTFFEINIPVGRKNYPMRIKKGDQKSEARFREAAKLIKEALTHYSEYKDQDERDHLSMALIFFVTKMLEIKENEDIVPIINEIKKLNLVLEDVLEDKE